MPQQKTQKKEGGDFRRIMLIIVLLLALLLILLFFINRYGSQRETPRESRTRRPASGQAFNNTAFDSSLLTEDDSLTDQTPSSLSNTISRKERIPKKTVPDSSTRPLEQLKTDSCAPSDTTPPVLAADPTGGLYYHPVYVKLVSNEPCSIFYVKSPNVIPGIKKENVTALYTDQLHIDKNLILYFYGRDLAGNSTKVKIRRYDINPAIKNPCPRNMAFVFSRNSRLCIDQYEWPNRRYKIPSSFVNWRQAGDSCRSVEKRLCTADEWYNACSDFGRQVYPYGEDYENASCVTEKTEMQKAGKSRECMSYYGVYDMSGNLAEWTSTPAPENPRFYKVMGGYWSSHSASRCSDYKYSFYPQNQSVSVGFRCCFDP